MGLVFFEWVLYWSLPIQTIRIDGKRGIFSLLVKMQTDRGLVEFKMKLFAFGLDKLIAFHCADSTQQLPLILAHTPLDIREISILKRRLAKPPQYFRFSCRTHHL